MHVAAVHEKKRPFMCSICDLTFSQKAHLNRHNYKTHNEPIPQRNNMSLDSSEAEFKSNPIPTVHEENKPKSPIKKPFSCEKCHECFSQKPYLKVHMQTVHEGKPKKGIR